MKIKTVNITYNASQFPCCVCGRMINGSHELVFADLDGEAFKAYYHELCLLKVAKDVEGQITKAKEPFIKRDGLG